ncbi:MAG: heme/copper-type cytochrome/quinol oxidase subunit 1 [Patescibacteria group bacterium]|jgi:heme/copper-type cytochrome/quinol oxidase subunit 1
MIVLYIGIVLLFFAVLFLWESSRHMLEDGIIKHFMPFFLLGLFLCFVASATFFGFYIEFERYLWYSYSLTIILLILNLEVHK